MKRNIKLINLMCVVAFTCLIASCGGNNNSNSNDTSESESNSNYISDNPTSSTSGLKMPSNLSKTEMARVLSAREELNAVNNFERDSKKQRKKQALTNDEIFEITDDLYVMKEFPEVSNMGSYAANIIEGIKASNDSTLERINGFKEEVNVADLWATVEDNDNSFLMTTSNENVSLFERSSSDDSNFLSYHLNSSEDGRKAAEFVEIWPYKEARYSTKEGEFFERFELFDDSSSYSSYDNSLGYWQLFSSGKILNDPIPFYSFSQTENLSYELVFSDSYNDKTILLNINIIAPNDKFDVLQYNNSGFILFLSGFRGVDRIEKAIQNGKLSNGAIDLLNQVDVYFDNGTSMKVNDTFVDGKLRYYNGQGVHPEVSEHTTASLEFCFNDVESPDLVYRFEILEEFLKETGMECKIDLDLIKSEIEKIQFKASHLAETYKWNGYGVQDQASLEAALAKEIEKFDKVKAQYNAIKDNPSIEFDETDENYVYSQLSDASVNLEDLKIEDNKIKIDNLKFALNDTNTLEENKEYQLNLAYAKGSEKIISKVLSGSKITKQAFNGANFEIMLTDEFDLPLDLNDEEYSLIAYLTTLDGVRVTEKKELFFNVEEEIIASVKRIKVDSNNEVLSFIYQTNEEQIITPTKEQYTYDELVDELALYAIENNLEPRLAIEKLEENAYVLVDKGATIEEGTYRMSFSNAYTEKGYIYITI